MCSQIELLHGVLNLLLLGLLAIRFSINCRLIVRCWSVFLSNHQNSFRPQWPCYFCRFKLCESKVKVWDILPALLLESIFFLIGRIDERVTTPRGLVGDIRLEGKPVCHYRKEWRYSVLTGRESQSIYLEVVQTWSSCQIVHHLFRLESFLPFFIQFILSFLV